MIKHHVLSRVYPCKRRVKDMEYLKGKCTKCEKELQIPEDLEKVVCTVEMKCLWRKRSMAIRI